MLVTMDYPPQIGGIANYWAHLSRYFTRGRFMVLAPSEKKQGARGERAKQVSVSDGEHAPFVLRKKFFTRYVWPQWLGLLFFVYRAVKKYRIGLVIAAQVLPVGTAVYMLKKTGLIAAYHVSCHGMDLGQLSGRKKILAGKVLGSAEKVMVNARYTAGLVRQFGIPESRIYMIRPCPSRFSGAERPGVLSRIPSQAPVVLSVGRLVARKGFDKVIEAMPLVWKKYPEIVYCIVGEGPDQARLEQVVARFVPEPKRGTIVFAGRAAQEELAGYYRRADIFAMPAREVRGDVEGFGMVFLEAGLFHLPVIGGRSGGVPEAVQDHVTGFVVDPFDEREIAKAITRLISEPEHARRLGQAGYEYARSFQWEKEAKKLQDEL